LCYFLVWLANLRELVDAVEVGEGLGDTLGHGLLALTDPDTGVVEPGWKVLLVRIHLDIEGL
jgi:hypothetical protein